MLTLKVKCYIIYKIGENTMQELEFVTMMVIMISCATASYRIGQKEGIRNALLYLEDEGVIELEDKE
tara:strand:+ start:314 stop:514 length:201 start_codon:yes stop_codon:yes gene_type:complete